MLTVYRSMQNLRIIKKRFLKITKDEFPLNLLMNAWLTTAAVISCRQPSSCCNNS